jgi:hypothetical protein
MCLAMMFYSLDGHGLCKDASGKAKRFKAVGEYVRRFFDLSE